MNKAELISRTTSLTEKEANEIYALTGSWNKVQEWAKLKDTGMSFVAIKKSITIGFNPSDAAHQVEASELVSKHTSIAFDKALDCVQVLSRPPQPVKRREAGEKLKEIYQFLSK